MHHCRADFPVIHFLSLETLGCSREFQVKFCGTEPSSTLQHAFALTSPTMAPAELKRLSKAVSVSFRPCLKFPLWTTLHFSIPLARRKNHKLWITSVVYFNSSSVSFPVEIVKCDWCTTCHQRSTAHQHQDIATDTSFVAPPPVLKRDCVNSFGVRLKITNV